MSTVLVGNCTDVLKTLPENLARTCITSPPYFGLRDYGHSDQLGAEKTVGQYVHALVSAFGEVRRVLTDDGTLWVNIADAYGKDKSLLCIPWLFALAMKADGWVLRQDIIWHKRNPMPEPAKDRCVRGHEYLFLFAKSARYFFNAEAIQEKSSGQSGGGFSRKYAEAQVKHGAMNLARPTDTGKRNKRSVWTTSVNSFRGAHFATYPPELIRPCVLAASEVGDVVLDPFAGSGTTGVVAIEEERVPVMIELNGDYAEMAAKRMAEVSQDSLQAEILLK